MHLVDYFVVGVRQADEIGIDRRPRPGTTPGIPFHKDILRGGSGGPDGINGRLIEVKYKRLVLCVEFVVCKCQLAGEQSL